METSKKYIRVKFVSRQGKSKKSGWTRQCPSNLPRWGDCEFIYDPFCREYDWLVVIDDVPRILPGNKEELACSKANTIFITTEPSSVTRYGKAFAAQFNQVLTSQEEEALPHPNAIRSQTGNIWYYGKSYDEILKTPAIPKTKLISTVCSSKRQAHTMHATRYDFTQRLKQHLPSMDIFGHGVRFVDKKADALDPYKFHLVVENHIAPHLWSEKLADAFLGLTVPIYCGCPNISDYFPADSVIPIDISDFEGSLEKIKSVLETEGEYERRLEAVKEARRLVMDEYNLPAMINRMITSAQPSDDKPGGILYGRQLMRVRHPADFISFAIWRAKNLFHKIRQSLGG